jgi:putative O-methyltransferase yrrM
MANVSCEVEQVEDKIKELEVSARSRGIPIMMSDGIDYLCDYINENNIKNILEIGSAIGYSAIRMALVDNDIKITTIERDNERYNEAVRNIDEFSLGGQIEIILGDAMDTEVNGLYDLIFIDASKGHNIDFFNKYKKNLKEHGVIITDNLSFHGLVENEELAITRGQRGIVRKIKNFIEFLDKQEDFYTEYISLGDKIAVSKRK